jgi:glutamate-5-semialdehyde dehydrogenase
MAIATEVELDKYCADVAARAKRAAARLSVVGGGAKIEWLERSAALIRRQSHQLEQANARDIDAAPGYGLSEAQIDRLRLTPKRIDEIAAGLLDVAALPEPIGQVIHSTVRPNGLRIDKVRVPLGVVLFIYESRPNVTADAAAICVKRATP